MKTVMAMLRVLLCLLCGVQVLPAWAEVLRVGYFDLPPHSRFSDEAQGQGVAEAYFEPIARRMSLDQVSYKRYPLPRLLLMLEHGALDMALVLAKTAEREAQLVYPSRPLFVTTPVLALARQHPLQAIHSVEDLLPLRLGIWQDGFRSALLLDSRLRVHSLSGDRVVAQGLGMILAKRIDGFYHPDILAVDFEIQRAGLAAQLRLVKLPEQGVALYSAFSRQAAARYLASYEQALEHVQAEQSYAAFFQQYMLR